MRLKPLLLLLMMVVLICGCDQRPSAPTAAADTAAQTQAAAGTATAMMEAVRDEFAVGQTATAAVEKAVEEALTTAVAAAVAQTLTAVLPPASTTPPPPPAPTNTPLSTAAPLPSETPTTPPTLAQPLLPSATAAQVCYQVLDPWCNTHQGCSTVDVRNQSGMNSSWHVWSDKEGVDDSFTVPPGTCTLVTRPGRYSFYITYCGGEVADFSWQLNDNWWYKISPCD